MYVFCNVFVSSSILSVHSNEYLKSFFRQKMWIIILPKFVTTKYLILSIVIEVTKINWYILPCTRDPMIYLLILCCNIGHCYLSRVMSGLWVTYPGSDHVCEKNNWNEWDFLQDLINYWHCNEYYKKKSISCDIRMDVFCIWLSSYLIVYKDCFRTIFNCYLLRFKVNQSWSY